MKNKIFGSAVVAALSLGGLFMSANAVLAAPPVANITKINVGSQTGVLTYGTAGSATYAGVATSSSNGTASISVTGLPIGASASAGNLNFNPGNGNVDTFTLTVTTAATTTPTTGTTFTVHNSTNATTTTGNLVIAKKPITVTVTASNKAYDGNNSATITNCTPNGLVGADVVTCSAAGATFSNKNVAAGKTVTATGITLGGANAGNYTLSSATATTTADITAVTLTTTGVTGVNKTYDQTTTASIDASSAVLSGVLGADDVSLDATSATGAFADKNVGNGKTVTVSGLVLSGADAGNYTLTQPTTTANITERNLTATATGVNKTYDGNTTATVTMSTDKLGADDVTASYTGATFADKNVGTGKTVSVTGVNITGTDSLNYNLLAGFTSTTANITPKDITFGATASDKVYDGTTAAGVSLSTSDIVGGDSIFATSDSNFSDKNVGTGKAVTISNIVLGGADAGNYNLTSNSAASTANITARDLNVTATGVSKVYDGGTAATVTLDSDLIGGDDLTLSYSSADFADPNVGTGIAISVTGISISGGADAGNYNLVNTTANTSANITQSAGQITLDTSNLNRVYDGTPQSVAVTSTTPNGLAYVVTYDGSSTAPTAVGSYTVLAAINDTNYAGTDSQTLVIAKADQTITFNSLSDKTFGDADFDVSATSDSGLSVSFTVSGNCSISGSTVSITGAGSCTVTAHQTGDGNYNAASDVNQAFNINKADQTINFGPLSDKAITDPDFTVSATSTSGLTVAFSSVSAACSVSGSTVHLLGAGTCLVTAAQAGDSNYNPAPNVDQSFTVASSTHTITASAGVGGSISPSGAVSVADGTDQNFTITANTGFEIADVLVDGVSVGAVASHNFVGVTADHTIAVSFFEKPILTIIKHTDTGSGDDTFTFQVQGTGDTVYGTVAQLTTVNGSSTSADIYLKGGVATTTYNVLETIANGWHLADVSCVYDNESIGNSIQQGEAIALQNGDHVTCTFTNTKRGTLIVKKAVVNNNGGNKTAGNFSFQVNNGDPITFTQDGENSLLGENHLVVDAGTYTVTEPATSGYDSALNNCSNLEIAAGGEATCTITNDDIAPVTTSGGGGGGGAGGGVLLGGGGTGGGQVLGASTGPNGGTGSGTETGGNVNGGGQVLGVTTFRFNINLRYGMKNNDVMELQKVLAKLGFFKSTPTGYFGPITLAAVKAYQASKGIPTTGFVGVLTRAALNAYLASGLY